MRDRRVILKRLQWLATCIYSNFQLILDMKTENKNNSSQLKHSHIQSDISNIFLKKAITNIWFPAHDGRKVVSHYMEIELESLRPNLYFVVLSMNCYIRYIRSHFPSTVFDMCVARWLGNDANHDCLSKCEIKYPSTISIVRDTHSEIIDVFSFLKADTDG